ncbi:MAG: hypothetical protein Q7U57_17345 [Methylovulum sp.]|nr:hypothetical protein [Methylovulum sp.]
MFDNYETNPDYDRNDENGKDKFAKLKAMAAGELTVQQPIHWHHEEHKPLIGTIKGFGEFIHDRYGLQKTIIVERENGEVVSAFMNAYIANGMERSHAQPGDRVLIQLLGKAKSQDGNQYNQFLVYVEKANY